MAYNPYLNNPYLQQYIPMMQQPVQQPMQQPVMQQPIQQTIQTNIIWGSENDARNYPVAPGNTVMIMDNDNPVAYKKAADLSGRALPLEIYDLVRRDALEPKEEQHLINSEEYITRKEFESFTESIEQRFTDMEEEEVIIQPKRKVKKDAESV